MKINWKHLFDWDIDAVSEPKQIMVKNFVVGYDVAVHYKHHGEKIIFFDNRKANYSYLYSNAQEAAQCTYQQYVDKMNTQKRR